MDRGDQMSNLRPKVDIKFKTWWEDYLKDLATTGSRLLQCGVSEEKVKHIITSSVKEVISDAVEITLQIEE